MYSKVRVLKEIRRQLQKAQSWVDSCPDEYEDEWEEELKAYSEASGNLSNLITVELEGA